MGGQLTRDMLVKNIQQLVEKFYPPKHSFANGTGYVAGGGMNMRERLMANR